MATPRPESWKFYILCVLFRALRRCFWVIGILTHPCWRTRWFSLWAYSVVSLLVLARISGRSYNEVGRLMLEILLLASCMLTTVFIVVIFRSRRSEFVFPSTWFLVFYSFFILWPSWFYYDSMIGSLRELQTEVVVLLSSLPLLILVKPLIAHGSLGRYVFNEAQSTADVPKSYLWFLSMVFVLFMATYFIYVPVTSTGLYSALSGDSAFGVREAREQSLKLLPDVPRYLYVFATVVIGNIICIGIVNKAVIRKRDFGFSHTKGYLVLSVIAVFSGIVLSGLSGARMSGGVVVLTLGVFFFVRSGCRLSYAIPLVVFTLLALVILIDIIRSDEHDVIRSVENVFMRIWYIRLESCIETVRVVEYQGYYGISGVRPLAYLFGVEYIDVANTVARYMYPNSPLASGLANCTFVFSYFANFGLWSLPFCVLLVFILDLLVVAIVKFVDRKYYAMALAGVLTPTFFLVETDYTQIFITRGCLLWVALCAFASYFNQKTMTIAPIQSQNKGN